MYDNFETFINFFCRNYIIKSLVFKGAKYTSKVIDIFSTAYNSK